MAVGSHSGSVQNAVELLDLATWTWETRMAYPFASTIWDAPIIHTKQTFFLFGGDDQSTRGWSSRIAAYDPSTDEWTSEGNLLTPRHNAGIIAVADSFLIVGGFII